MPGERSPNKRERLDRRAARMRKANAETFLRKEAAREAWQRRKRAATAGAG